MIENLPNEEWLDVAGYEGMYRISNMGRVLSLLRREPAILAGNPNNRGIGYLQVQFRKDGGRKLFLIHRLVMLAFAPTENAETLHVNHIDFNPRNCSLANLEWATPQENVSHYHDSGKKRNFSKLTGSNHHLSSLTEEKVLEIRRLYLDGAVNQKEIGQRFGISVSTVGQITSGKTWKNLLPCS